MLAALALLSAGGLLAVWIVYPLVIAGFAVAIRQSGGATRRAQRGTPPSSVSLILATRDDPHAVRARVLDCLAAASAVPSCEIIVAIDARAASTARADLALGPQVTIVSGDEPGGKAATLNAAVRAARGDLLVFTDTHQRFAPGALGRLAAAFSDARVGAASGRLELSESARHTLVGRYWAYERWLRRCEASVHSCVGATGAIWALRRSLWVPLPPALILDDVYTPMRVVLSGHRVAFIDDARAVDSRRADPSLEYRRKVRTLTGNLQLIFWMPELLLPVRNPVWPQFLFHKLLRLLTPYWALGVLAWIAAMMLSRIASMAALPTLVASLLCVMGAAVASRRLAIGRTARRAVHAGVLLQLAPVVAMMNGLRRRWNVWHPE